MSPDERAGDDPPERDVGEAGTEGAGLLPPLLGEGDVDPLTEMLLGA